MWRTFFRSQLSSFVSTIIDYSVLLIWVEVLHRYYPFGVALGASFGSVANFFMNRHWSFEASKSVLHWQALRYAIVSLGSLILNTSGVYALTEYAGLYYLVSQVTISICVGLFYNFPLNRFFVYKKKEFTHDSPIHFTTT